MPLLLADPLGLGYDVPLPSLADLHACRDGRAEPILRPVVALARRESVARPRRRAARKPKPAPSLPVRVELVRLDPSEQLALPAPPSYPKAPRRFAEPDWNAPEIRSPREDGRTANRLGCTWADAKSWSGDKSRWTPSVVPTYGYGTVPSPRVSRDPKVRAEKLAAVAAWFAKNARPGVSFTFGPKTKGGA